MNDGEEPETFDLAERSHRELQTIIREFRSTFYNRHLSGYLNDDTPDVNLRYRGSIQQLLNISNLILDSMVEVVLGDRACLATIGDTTVPEIDSPCGVVVAHLHADTLKYPMLLETLGHEVGHQLVIDLLSAASDRTETHCWADGERRASNFMRVRRAFDTIASEVFLGSLTVNHVFMEVAADFVEFVLMGGEFEDWARSHMHRSLLVADTIGYPDSDGDVTSAGRVPVVDPRIIHSSIIRVSHVAIFDALAHEQGDWGFQSFDRFASKVKAGALSRLRKVLTECLLGPSDALRLLVTDERRWDEFLKYVVFAAQWLWTFEAAGHTADFAHQIVRHVEGRKVVVPSWTPVCQQMSRLRTVVLGHLSAAVHVRHWIDWEERGHVGPALLRESYSGPLPWLVSVPPALNPDSSDLGENVTAVVLQRGRVVPVTPQSIEAVNSAHAEYVFEMFALAPQWRKTIADRANRIEHHRLRSSMGPDAGKGK
jgi:hypothetical protein